MDILNSGSFVTLDNREKIEQLIFTAKSLATELSQTDGFQSSGPTNHQLGLEMWKGAEYVCRAHEEATIRNLFLSKFLEKLREIERQTAVQPRPPQTPAVNPTTTQSPISEQAQVATSPSTSAVPISMASSQEVCDEYLGVISETLPTESDRPSYAAECVPEWEAACAETGGGSETDEIVATEVDESTEDQLQESFQTDIPRAEELPVNEADYADTPESGSIEESAEEVINRSTTPDGGTGVASIVLSEKEPYNFDSCTVTAVIQLLPESGGMRKCIVSVRSHDFAPQITISEFGAGEINEHPNLSLTEAIGLYRTELPALAAEKIKKAKPATKKRTTKSNDKSTTSAAGETSTASITVPPAAQNEVAKDQQNLFAS